MLRLMDYNHEFVPLRLPAGHSDFNTRTPAQIEINTCPTDSLVRRHAAGSSFFS